MSRVVMVLHPGRAEAKRAALDLTNWLVDSGHVVEMSATDADLVSLPEAAAPLPELAVGADLAMSIGGDGTMLRTVDLVADSGTPVLGINSGRLGYLTEIELDGAQAALEAFFRGDHRIESRMRIDLSVERADGSDGGSWTALNEGVVEKRAQGHTVHLAVAFNGERFTTYPADGLIVSTATGSTAYSMSARGPIVEPGLRALLFTPASPHTLFDRSLVLDPTSEIRITVASARDAILSVDGRPTATLTEGDTVVATESSVEARLVTFDSRSFHAVLKSKFGLHTHMPGDEA